MRRVQKAKPLGAAALDLKSRTTDEQQARRSMQFGRNGKTFVLSFAYEPDLIRQINAVVPQARWSAPADAAKPGQQITPRILAGLDLCQYTLPITLDNAAGLRRVLRQFRFSSTKTVLATFTEALSQPIHSMPVPVNSLQPNTLNVFAQSASNEPAQTPVATKSSVTGPPLPKAPITLIRDSLTGRVQALRTHTPRDPENPTRLATGCKSEGLYDTVMNAPGARWIKQIKGTPKKPGRDGHFRIPITLVTPALIKTLHQQYGLTLDTESDKNGKAPARLIAEEVDRLRRNIRLSMADQMELRLPVPNGKEYLPYQKAGIAYALRAGNALIADEPGLGKTIQAVGVSNALKQARRILVIPPASLKTNWQREWESWCTKGLKVTRVLSDAADAWPSMNPDAPDATNVVVVNFDLIEAHQAQINRQVWDILRCRRSPLWDHNKVGNNDNKVGNSSSATVNHRTMAKTVYSHEHKDSLRYAPEKPHSKTKECHKTD